MKNKTPRAMLAVLSMVCAAPLAARAEGPTSRPANRAFVDRNEHDANERNNADRPMRPKRPGIARTPVSPEQWSQIIAFMQEYSPRRTADLQNLAPADDQKANYLKQLFAAQYDYIMGLKNEDLALYELQVSKISAQDAIYGMLRDTRSGMNDKQKSEFRTLVEKLVDVNLNERERRIERARESLARAEVTLEEDRKNKADMVTDRMEQFMREGARPFKMDPPERQKNLEEQGGKKDGVTGKVFGSGEPVEKIELPAKGK